MLDNYEQQWPMMVYMHKYLAHGRRKKRKAAKRDLNVDNLTTDEGSMSEAVVHADTDAKRGCSSLVSSIIDDIISHPEFEFYRYLMTIMTCLCLIHNPLPGR
jgi:hypothetical protein